MKHNINKGADITNLSRPARGAWIETIYPVFHHQRIFHLPGLKNQHDRLVEAIGWLEPELLKHVQIMDRFNEIYADGLEIIAERIKKINHEKIT